MTVHHPPASSSSSSSLRHSPQLQPDPSLVNDPPDPSLPLPPPPRLHKLSDPHSAPSLKDSKLISLCPKSLCHSFPGSRPHRRSKPDDDPFLLALKVCTEDDAASFTRLHTPTRPAVGPLRNKEESRNSQCISAQENRSSTKRSASTRTRLVRSSNFSSDWDLRPDSALSRGRKHIHAVHVEDSNESLPILTGKHGENNMPDAELDWRSGEILAGGKVYRALQRCRDRLRRLSVDFEEIAPSTRVMSELPKGLHTTVKRTDRDHQRSHGPVELCGHPAKRKQLINGKQLLPDIFGCKSSHSLRDSVMEPCLSKGGRVSSHRI